MEEIKYGTADGVATITLNRPDVHNAYTVRTLRELAAAFQEASFDDAVAVIVYTGAGTRAFCTGGDVREYAEVYTKQPHEYWKYMGLFRAYIESILRCGKPVIARLNGMAVGGGNESQLACDLTVAAEHAWMGQVGVGVGSVACGGATQWLPLVVGDKRAREMLMLNERISARQALEWGLVNRVVPSVRRGESFVERASPEEIDKAFKERDGYRIDLSKLDAEVADLAERLKAKFPECLRYTKAQANALKTFVWDSTIPHAQDWLSVHFACGEPREGMKAFVEKRPPDVARIRRELAQGGAPELQ
jgi:enoyl-CoA hydratase/carnithine racemase